jgi:putative heme-binding domain-containing protein
MPRVPRPVLRKAYNVSVVRFSLILVWTGTAIFGQEVLVTNSHTTAADQAAGAKIFRSHCAPCHGAAGQGGLGPNLANGIFFHGCTDADLYRTITEGIPGTAMPGTFFDGTEVWQVVAYLRSLAGQAGEVARGDARRGEALFRGKGCGVCHLIRGEGGIQGPDLSSIGSRSSIEHIRQSILNPDAQVPVEYRVARITLRDNSSYSGFILNEDTYTVQLLDFSKGLESLRRSDFKSFDRSNNSSMPTFRGKLTDIELDDLVSYLGSLKREMRSE